MSRRGISTRAGSSFSDFGKLRDEFFQAVPSTGRVLRGDRPNQLEPETVKIGDAKLVLREVYFVDCEQYGLGGLSQRARQGFVFG